QHRRAVDAIEMIATTCTGDSSARILRQAAQMTSPTPADPPSFWRSLALTAQPVRVLFVLATVLAAALAAGQIDAVPALLVGALASAFAETDDGWRGRLRAQLATLAALAAAALVVEAVSAQPV